jgi:hypothetical protein
MPRLTPEQVKRRSELEELQLQRTRVLHDLSTATNPRYRESLEAGLRFLEEKIKALG